jgi:hypothetical protein
MIYFSPFYIPWQNWINENGKQEDDAVQAKNKLYNMYKVTGGKRLLVTGN